MPGGRLRASGVTAPAVLAKVPERSRSIPPSPLHKIHRRVEQRGGDVIALHVGEPYVPLPETAQQGFVDAVRGGRTAYTDAPGLPALREALAEQLAANGAPSADNVFVTPGSCQAIAAVLLSLASDGAVALLPEVHWPTHLQQLRMAGFRPRFFPLPGTGGSTVEALEAAWESGTRVLIVNSPSNPSGSVLSAATIADIHAWAVRRGVYVISDEAYEDFVYEGSTPAMAALDAPLPPAERVVFSVHTFSKGFSMTGCRLGYVTAPNRKRADRLRRVQEATLIAPSTPVQYAGLAALADRSHLARHHAYVRATRDAAVAMLAPSGLLWQVPTGGWYALLDIGAYTADAGRWCRSLLDRAGVALAPGAGFVPRGHPLARRVVRLALCAEREATLEGIRRLRARVDPGAPGP
jgi:aspartate aminotransferase